MPRKKKSETEKVKEGNVESTVGSSKEVKEEKMSAAKIEELKKRIEEKAKELEFKVKIKEDINLDDVERPKEELLVSLEEYVKSGIHLGTKVITEQMRPYVYKRRADGLAVFNTSIIDKKLRLLASMLSKYSPESIIVTGKREASWKALKAFSKATGIRVFTKKYPAGIITNPNLEEFFEPKLTFVVDPWLDKNPISDALIVNIPIVALCDTNNLLSNADLIVPCNNKSNKSIGLIFWILAKQYNKMRKIETTIPPLSEFTGE